MPQSYEIEYKVELTETEKVLLVDTLQQNGFIFEKTTPQRDVYVKAVRSPYYELDIGAPYDLIRYRNEDGKYIYTEKTWEIIGGQPTRKEDEHMVSGEEFETETAKYPDAITIEKTRDWFSGKYKDTAVSVTIDSVLFGHSPKMRYFVEAEINTADKTKIAEMRELVIGFLKEMLGRQELTEAYGMFSMAFEKK